MRKTRKERMKWNTLIDELLSRRPNYRHQETPHIRAELGIARNSIRPSR